MDVANAILFIQFFYLLFCFHLIDDAITLSIIKFLEILFCFNQTEGEAACFLVYNWLKQYLIRNIMNFLNSRWFDSVP